MAEREGFEPSGACAPAVFKTAALNHSTIFPLDFDTLMLVIYKKCTRNAFFSSHLMKKNENIMFFIVIMPFFFYFPCLLRYRGV